MRAQHLVTTAEMRAMVRPMSRHLDDNEVLRAIEEVEDTQVIPQIGFDIYSYLVNNTTLDADRTILRDGGQWQDGALVNYCHGLRQAVAAQAYAKLVKINGQIVTRSGVIQHNDQYGQRVQGEDASDAWRDAVNVADFYLRTCWDYWNSRTENKTNKKRVTQKVARIMSVGD